MQLYTAIYAFLLHRAHCGKSHRDEHIRRRALMSDQWAYIWPAYGISAVALGALIVYVWRRNRALKRRLADLEAREER